MIRKTISCMAIAVAAILTSVYTLTGCQSHQGDENQLENDIDSFATYYFNWQSPRLRSTAPRARNLGYAMLPATCIRRM